MSFEEECDLTSTLAYLSGVSGDHKHVTGVCAEEGLPGQGIKIWVAINKATPSSADDTLAEAKKGFENILSVLSAHGPSTNETHHRIYIYIKSLTS